MYRTRPPCHPFHFLSFSTTHTMYSRAVWGNKGVTPPLALASLTAHWLHKKFLCSRITLLRNHMLILSSILPQSRLARSFLTLVGSASSEEFQHTKTKRLCNSSLKFQATIYDQMEEQRSVRHCSILWLWECLKQMPQVIKLVCNQWKTVICFIQCNKRILGFGETIKGKERVKRVSWQMRGCGKRERTNREEFMWLWSNENGSQHAIKNLETAL